MPSVLRKLIQCIESDGGTQHFWNSCHSDRQSLFKIPEIITVAGSGYSSNWPTGV